jgi:hypothetical protein
MLVDSHWYAIFRALPQVAYCSHRVTLAVIMCHGRQRLAILFVNMICAHSFLHPAGYCYDPGCYRIGNRQLTLLTGVVQAADRLDSKGLSLLLPDRQSESLYDVDKLLQRAAA